MRPKTCSPGSKPSLVQSGYPTHATHNPSSSKRPQSLEVDTKRCCSSGELINGRLDVSLVSSALVSWHPRELAACFARPLTRLLPLVRVLTSHIMRKNNIICVLLTCNPPSPFTFHLTKFDEKQTRMASRCAVQSLLLSRVSVHS